MCGVAKYIGSYNGPEFIAQAVQNWITVVGAKTAYITPGRPRENEYCQSFHARLRDELLNGEIFYCVEEAWIMIENRRELYNRKHPHSSLGYRPKRQKASRHSARLHYPNQLSRALGAWQTAMA